MPILLSDQEFSDLQGRVTELEALLKQVEAKKQFQIAVQPRPATPPVAPPPLPTVASSPPPISQPTEWPSQWAPPASQDKIEQIRAQEAQAQEKEPAPVVESVQARVESVRLQLERAQQEKAQTQAQPQVEVEPVKAPEPEKVTTPLPMKEEPKVQPSASSEMPFSIPPVPQPVQQVPEKSLLDWENLIGGRLALWVGALCVFLALASLLVYVGKTLPPPPPSARVAAGFVGSFVLFGCALAARKRGQRWFVDGFLGTGLALGFLSVWGGGPHFGLWPMAVSLLGFSLYSGAGIFLSARRNSQALLILSSVGGYLTPILVRNNNAQSLAFVFLSYLLVLNAGIVTVCVAKKWRQITYSAFVTTVVMLAGWALEANIESMRPMLWVFATLGWLLFAGAACFRPLAWGEKSEVEDSPLLLSATGIYATTSQWLLFRLMKGFPGDFSLGLTAVLGALWWLSRRRVPKDDALQTHFLALACVAGTLFIPLQFGQSGLVWGWTAQSVALLFIGRKTGNSLLLNSSRTVWGIALVALLSDLALSLQTPQFAFDGFSLRALFFLLATAVSLWDEQEETWMPVYGLLLSWGGAYWLGRTSWLAISNTAVVAPKQTTEAWLLIGAGAITLWSLFLWRYGWWRRQALMRANSWLILGLALCTIGGVGLWGQAPLVALRVVAFAVEAAALLALGMWQARHEEEEKIFSCEATGVATACWIAFGLTIEIAAHWHKGTFALPASGTTAWFALCIGWSLFAVGAGAVSIWRSWVQMWTVAETLFAVSTGVLLLQSLLVPDILVPLGNMRLGAFVVAWGVALLARQVDGDSQHKDWWLLALSLLPLWATTQELWNGVAANYAYFGPEWRRFASLSVSLCWSFYAMLCLVIGVVRRVQNLRIGALSLGALAVCKVFLFDLAFLDGGLRVLSLGGLGAALLFISWLYSRFGRIEKSATA